VVLWNCAHPDVRVLSPEYVNTADGLDLHQFRFLKDETIGHLPKTWNHLVGYDQHNIDSKLIHWTTGGPYFDEYKNVDYHQDWFKEKTLSETILQRKDVNKP
jgi:hypothetical protein